MTRICGEMLVTIIRHVIGFQRGRVIFEDDVVEKLRDFNVTGILTCLAENICGIVHFDMNVPESIEVTRFLVEMSAVAVKIRRILTQYHASDKTFDILAERLLINLIVGVHDMDKRLAVLLGVENATDTCK